MPTYVKDGGVWKEPKSFSVKDAGAWKTVQAAWVKDGGVWKQVWPNGPKAPQGTLIPDFATFNSVYWKIEVHPVTGNIWMGDTGVISSFRQYRLIKINKNTAVVSTENIYEDPELRGSYGSISFGNDGTGYAVWNCNVTNTPSTRIAIIHPNETVTSHLNAASTYVSTCGASANGDYCYYSEQTSPKQICRASRDGTVNKAFATLTNYINDLGPYSQVFNNDFYIMDNASVAREVLVISPAGVFKEVITTPWGAAGNNRMMSFCITTNGTVYFSTPYGTARRRPGQAIEATWAAHTNGDTVTSCNMLADGLGNAYRVVANGAAYHIMKIDVNGVINSRWISGLTKEPKYLAIDHKLGAIYGSYIHDSAATPYVIKVFKIT